MDPRVSSGSKVAHCFAQNHRSGSSVTRRLQLTQTHRHLWTAAATGTHVPRQLFKGRSDRFVREIVLECNEILTLSEDNLPIFLSA